MDNENNSPDVKVVDSTKPKSKIVGKCGFLNQKNGEGIYKGGICWDDMLQAASEGYLITGTNGKRYFDIKIVEHRSKQKDNHGNTHLVLLLKKDENNFENLSA